MKKTSVMHKDIGKHEHEVTIFNSYEVYAVCTKCGMHDWSLPEGTNDSDDSTRQMKIDHFRSKYPKHSIDNTAIEEALDE